MKILKRRVNVLLARLFKAEFKMCIQSVLRLCLLTVCVVFLMVACSDTSSSTQLTGDIEIDGSSTVFPITEAVAEEFRKENPKVRVNVGVSGTGGGFKRFVNGETDINDASRPIRDKEIEEATENSILYTELEVAIDGLSVVANLKSDFISCLTLDELKLIWEPESQVDSWNDIRPEWPNSKINLYGPGTDSGTFDYFTEEVVGEAGASRADYTASEDDNVLVRGINGDKNSLGYFGYAYYRENTDKLKLIAVDSGDGCVEPTDQTILDGTYKPLSRPLYIYVNNKSVERTEFKAFINFFMKYGSELSSEVGYVPLPQETYKNNLNLIK